ncbi:hypothetical protein QQF64_023773 [Cirrhinus molitorella]|uniref:Uncharacterized protein n=1 Tax=Cirrhinus molitorella TaxID=172907 RepID=A0ABR3NJI3_9TELE
MEWNDAYASNKGSSSHKLDSVKTRDTNCHVEKWFGIVKSSILPKKRHVRPADFIQALYSSLKGRYMEHVLKNNLPENLLVRPIRPMKSPVFAKESWEKKEEQAPKKVQHLWTCPDSELVVSVLQSADNRTSYTLRHTDFVTLRPHEILNDQQHQNGDANLASLHVGIIVGAPLQGNSTGEIYSCTADLQSCKQLQRPDSESIRFFGMFAAVSSAAVTILPSVFLKASVHIFSHECDGTRISYLAFATSSTAAYRPSQNLLSLTKVWYLLEANPSILRKVLVIITAGEPSDADAGNVLNRCDEQNILRYIIGDQKEANDRNRQSELSQKMDSAYRPSQY